MAPDSAKQILRSAPYFPVGDVKETAEYYRSVMGFEVEYSAGSPPEFAIVTRDGLSIMLRRVATPAEIKPSEKQGGSWDAFFWVANAGELHAELAAKSADVVYGPLIQQHYNMREFAVRDPDGHILGFGESLKK